MMQGQMSMTTSGEHNMYYDLMMLGVTPMHDDVAQYLGMTTQELYDHMAAGKSMAQVAAEMGFTEQQLMDAVMMGRQAASGKAVQDGYLTQDRLTPCCRI